MTFDGPAPTVTIAEALTSPARRVARDRQIAAWCGMDAGETQAFLERVALFDLRTRADEEEQANARLAAAQRTGRIMRRLPPPRAAA